MAVAFILKEHVAAADGGYKQILVAVIVNVSESRALADAPGHADARFLCDVLELAIAQVLPELVASDLVQEVDVVQSVAVDIRNRFSVNGAVNVYSCLCKRKFWVGAAWTPMVLPAGGLIVERQDKFCSWLGTDDTWNTCDPPGRVVLELHLED
jgi:hypothetical protein